MATASPLGKIAVVVGVGPGAGAGIARKFAAEGYKVALTSRRIEPLQKVEAEIKAAGGVAISITSDAGKESDVKAAYKKIVDTWGASPEVLVYNAGPGTMMWPPKSLIETSVEDFSKGFDSGVTGALAWTQQVLPAQLKAQRGTILYTGATASLRGGAKFSLLACPKFALRALAQSAAREFQSQGVHVAHIIIDGTIYSPRIRAMMPDKPEDASLSPDAIADVYWHLHTQHRSAWSQEVDLRPFLEKF